MQRRKPADTSVYLPAPVNALVEGFYKENASLAEIRRHRDFGIGTFNDLGGEMLLLDGVFCQTRSDGRLCRSEEEGLRNRREPPVRSPITHFIPNTCIFPPSMVHNSTRSTVQPSREVQCKTAAVPQL
jgi:alpha-acetolactate decarboxylase